jgi:hypothetical protein
MEAWNSTFKVECVERFLNNDVARNEAFDFIEVFYNRMRLGHRRCQSGRVRGDVHGEASSLVQLSTEPDQAQTLLPSLKVFWETHDPTSGDRQGPDRGHQYRSAIFTFGPEQQSAALASRDAEHARLMDRITSEISPGRPLLDRRGIPPAVGREAGVPVLPGAAPATWKVVNRRASRRPRRRRDRRGRARGQGARASAYPRAAGVARRRQANDRDARGLRATPARRGRAVAHPASVLLHFQRGSVRAPPDASLRSSRRHESSVARPPRTRVARCIRFHIGESPP